MMDSITVGAKIRLTENVGGDYPVGEVAISSFEHESKIRYGNEFIINVSVRVEHAE